MKIKRTKQDYSFLNMKKTTNIKNILVLFTI